MIIELLLFSGLRARELCQLKVIDLPLSHGKNSIYVRDGKGRVSRVVEIPADLVAKLEHFIKFHWSGAKPDSAVIPSEQGYRLVHWRTYRLRKNRRPGESKYIVEKHHEYTAGLSYHSLYSKLTTIGRKAKIGRLTPHMFRHTYLTRLYNIACDIRLIQLQAGHASINTATVYAQTESESARRQVESIVY
jgi:integrase